MSNAADGILGALRVNYNDDRASGLMTDAIAVHTADLDRDDLIDLVTHLVGVIGGAMNYMKDFAPK